MLPLLPLLLPFLISSLTACSRFLFSPILQVTTFVLGKAAKFPRTATTAALFNFQVLAIFFKKTAGILLKSVIVEIETKIPYNINISKDRQGQTMNKNKQEQVITNFRDVFNKMAWLNELKMKDSLKGYKSSEVHCIEYIGKTAASNVTTLAEAFYMTRGAISKLTKKLIEKGLINSYQKPDNKKEIYFKLTAQGQKVFDIHEALHKEFGERDKAVFEQITEEQFNDILCFMEKYSGHLDTEIKKLGINFKPE